MLTCLRCGNQWEPRKVGALPKRCPSCQNATWNRPYQRHVATAAGVIARNIDKAKESAIIETVSAPSPHDPDGALMQAAPSDPVAEAKRRAMELFRKVADGH
jgi:hypothetical protein